MYLTSPSSDLVNYSKSINNISDDNIYEKYNIESMQNVRAFLEPSIKPDRFNLYYLVWLEEKNLEELDRRITANEMNYDDSDFRNAIKVNYKEGIICFKCQKVWDGFEVDHGDTYLGNKELLKIKTEIISESKSRMSCPNCKEPFRITIVKLIGEHPKLV